MPTPRILNRHPSAPDPLHRNFDLASFIPKGALTSTLFSLNLGFLGKAPVAWPFPEAPLDQNGHPACIGFGGAGFEGTAPVEDLVNDQAGHDLYYLCKIKDGEPKAEDGSTVHTLARVLRDLKRIKGYAWAHSTLVISWWLRHKGPLVFGTDWTQDMMNAGVDNFIHPTGVNVGGHCTCGRKIKTFSGGDAYYIQNSWNHEFGDEEGGAWMYASEVMKLLYSFGEALAAVEQPL